MNNRLSHSSIKLYSECGKKYEYHYSKRLREATRSGALCFGSAFDVATEAVLKNRSIDEKEVFDKAFTHQDINGTIVHIPDSLLVVYAAADFDSDLLDSSDVRHLKAKSDEWLSYKDEDALEIYDITKTRRAQRAYRTFSENEQRYYNLCNWMCLRRKGHLMLEANRKKVLPHITEVKGTQIEIKLANEEGDLVTGFADLVAKWDGSEDICFDYKTSARAYEEDAVKTSPQLALYCAALGLKRAGFLVFKKQVLKNRTKICSKCGFDGKDTRAKTCVAEIDDRRCGADWVEKIRPEIDVQILIDDVPVRTSEIVMENAEMASKGIKAGIFMRNFDSCIKPYGKCPFYNACHKNDESDLVQMPEKKLDVPA